MADRMKLAEFLVAINQPALVVSAFSPFLFPRAVIENPALNVVDFHNSIFRATADATRRPGRFEMDPVTGITWHEVVAELTWATSFIKSQSTVRQT